MEKETLIDKIGLPLLATFYFMLTIGFIYYVDNIMPI